MDYNLLLYLILYEEVIQDRLFDERFFKSICNYIENGCVFVQLSATNKYKTNTKLLNASWNIQFVLQKKIFNKVKCNHTFIYPLPRATFPKELQVTQHYIT